MRKIYKRIGSNNKLIWAVVTLSILVVASIILNISMAWFRDRDSVDTSITMGGIVLSDNYTQESPINIPILLSRQHILEEDLTFTPAETTSPFYVRYQVSFPVQEGTNKNARDILKYQPLTTYTTDDETSLNSGLQWTRVGEYFYLCNSDGVPFEVTKEMAYTLTGKSFTFMSKDNLLIPARLAELNITEDPKLTIQISIETVQTRNINSELDEAGVPKPGEDGIVDSPEDIWHAFITPQPTQPLTVSFYNGDALIKTESSVEYGGSVDYFVPTVDATDLFVEWNTSKDGLGAPMTAIVMAHLSESLNIYCITKKKDIPINVSFGEGGTILPNNGNGKDVWVKYGGDNTFSVVPDEGKMIDKVLVDGKEVDLNIVSGESYDYTFAEVKTAHSIEASFIDREIIIEYTLITEGHTEDQNTVTTTSASLAYGTGSYQIAVESILGYHISSILVDNASITVANNQRQVVNFTNIKQSHTVVATLSKTLYTIKYNKDSGLEEAGKENPTEYYITSPTIKFNPVIKAGYAFVGWYSNASYSGDKVTELPTGSTGNRELFAKYVELVDYNKAMYGYQVFPTIALTSVDGVSISPRVTAGEYSVHVVTTKSGASFSLSFPSDLTLANAIEQVRVFLNSASAPVNNFVVNAKDGSGQAITISKAVAPATTSAPYTLFEVNKFASFSKFSFTGAASQYIFNSIEMVTAQTRTNNADVSLIAPTVSLPNGLHYTFNFKKNGTSVNYTTHNYLNYHTVKESGEYTCDVSILDEDGNRVSQDYSLTYTVDINRDLSNTMADVTATYDAQPHEVTVGALPFGATVTYSYTATLKNGSVVTGTGNAATEAGDYVFTAVIDGGAYWNDLTLTANMTINRASLSPTLAEVTVLPGDVFQNTLTSSCSSISGITYSSDMASVIVASDGKVTISTQTNLARTQATITVDGGNNFESTSYVVNQYPYVFSNANTLSKYVGNETHVSLPESISGINVITNGIVTAATTRSYSFVNIANGAFNSVTNLVELHFPKTVTNIATGALVNLYSIQKIILDGDISTSYAISQAREGTWYRNGVETTELSVAGIYNNTGVVESTSADWEWEQRSDGSYSVTKYLGSDTKVKVPHSIYDIENGEYVTITGITSVTPDNKTQLTEVDISEGIKYIYASAFQSYTALTRISLPSSLVRVYDNAFNSCTGLTQAINLESCVNLTNIGLNAFRRTGNGISGNIDISHLDKLSMIGGFAFGENDNLIGMTLPSSTNCNYTMFYDCINQTTIKVEANGLLKAVDNVLFSADGTVLWAYALGQTNTSYAIPSSVTKIMHHAFHFAQNLTKITIDSENITEVNNGSFATSNALNVYVPSSKIDTYATLLSGTTTATGATGTAVNKGFVNGSLMYEIGSGTPSYGYNSTTKLWTPIYTITITLSGEGAGQVVPGASGFEVINNKVYVTAGLSYRLTAQPDENSWISKIVADGVNISTDPENGVPRSYSFEKISAQNHTLEVEFSKKVIEITQKVSGVEKKYYFSNMASAFGYASSSNGTEKKLTLLSDFTDTSTSTPVLNNYPLAYYSAYKLTMGNFPLQINSTAQFDIYSGTINAGTKQAILMAGIVNIYDGIINGSNSSGQTTIQSQNKGRLSVFGGRINGSTANTIHALNTSTYVRILGGVIAVRSGTAGILVQGGEFTMSAGTIMSDSNYALRIESNTTNPTVAAISGGTFTHRDDDASKTLGKYTIYYYSGSLSISGDPTIPSIHMTNTVTINQPDYITSTNSIRLYLDGFVNERVIVRDTDDTRDLIDANNLKFFLNNTQYGLYKKDQTIVIRLMYTINFVAMGNPTNTGFDSVTPTGFTNGDKNRGGTVAVRYSDSAEGDHFADGESVEIQLGSGQTIIVTARAGDGYRFDGWFSELSCLGDKLSSGELTVGYADLSGATTYYAKFVKIVVVNVDLNANVNDTNQLPVFTITPQDDYVDQTGSLGIDSNVIFRFDYSASSKSITAAISSFTNTYNISWGSLGEWRATAAGVEVSTSFIPNKETQTLTLVLTQMFTLTFQGTYNVTRTPTVYYVVQAAEGEPQPAATNTVLFPRTSTSLTGSVYWTEGANYDYNLVVGTTSALTPVNQSAGRGVENKVSATLEATLESPITEDKTIYFTLTQRFTITVQYTSHIGNSGEVKLAFESSEKKSDVISVNSSKTDSYEFVLLRKNSAESINATMTYVVGKYNFVGGSSMPTAAKTKTNTGTTLTVATSGAITENKTVYFVVSEITTFNVYYDDTKTNLVKSVTILVDEELTNLGIAAPVRLGYTNEGIYLGTTKLYNANSTVATAGTKWTTGGDIQNLFYKWSTGKFTVTFDSNGASPASSTAQVEFGGTYTLPARPTRTGYNFSSWQFVPDGYNQLEYIEFTGSQYFNTGYIAKINTTLETTITPSTAGKWVFGSRTAYANADTIAVYLNDTYQFWPQFTTDGTPMQNTPSNTSFIGSRFTLALDKNYLYYNGAALNSTKFGYSTFSSTHNIWFGALNQNGSPDSRMFVGKMYEAKIYEGNTLISYYIPAKNPQGVVGMWDAVQNKFIAPTGTLTASANVGEVTNETHVTIAKDHTVYASWTPSEYTVTLNQNGGSAGTPAVIAKYLQHLPKAVAPMRSGYEFKGYATSSNAVAMTPKSISGTTNLRVYLENYINEITTGVELTLVMKLSALPTRTDFNDTQISYTYFKDGNQYLVILKREVVELDITGTPTRNYDYNTMRFFDIEIPSGTTWEFMTCSMGGDFYYNQNMDSLRVYDKTENSTLYAVWDEDGYTIVYNSNGGTTFASEVKKTGDVLTLPTPTKDGYVFRGWVPTITLDGEKYFMVFYHDNKAGSALFSSATLASRSNVENGYSILGYMKTLNQNASKYEYRLYYESKGAGQYNHWTQTMNPLDYDTSSTSGVGYSPIKVSWTANSFAGLARSSSTSETFLDGSPAASTWYYAIGAYSAWNGGIPADSVAEKAGVTLLQKAVDIEGSYLGTISLGGIFVIGNFDKNLIPMGGSIELTALWSAGYNISYNTNGGTAVTQPGTKALGDRLTLPNTTRNGYTFRGWAPTVTIGGSKYYIVFYHNNNGGKTLFTSVAEAQKSVVPDKYSLLQYMTILNAGNSNYEFQLRYEEWPEHYNHWSQTSNPLNEYLGTSDSALKATGYSGIHVDWDKDYKYFGGLTRQNENVNTLSNTLLSGTVGHSNWYYAIGAYTEYQGGIPGPGGAYESTTKGVTLLQKVVSTASPSITSVVTPSRTFYVGNFDKNLIPLGGTLELVALWQPNTYNITFYGNGSTSGETTTKTATYNASLTGPTFSKTGYNFAGWAESSTGTSTSNSRTIYASDINKFYDEVGAGGTKNLYATWKARANITVTYSASGGALSDMTQWTKYTNPNATSISYNSSTKTNTINVTGVGGWEVIAVPLTLDTTAYHYIYFDYVMPEISSWVNADKDYVPIEIVSSLDNTNSDVVGTVVDYVHMTSGKSSTYKDLWFKPTTSTVYMLINLGYIGDGTTYTIQISNIRITRSKNVTFDSFYGDPIYFNVGNGYTIKNWYTAESGGTEVKSSTIVKNANDHTLYGTFTNIYKVTLDNQGATTAGTTAYYYKFGSSSPYYYYTNAACTTGLGSNGYTITKPTKTGYTFQGYYTGTNGSGTKYVDANGGCINNLYAAVAADLTLYAYWKPNTYTLSIDPNGGYRVSDNSTAVITVTKEYLATEGISERRRNGYTLTGWTMKNTASGSTTDLGGATVTFDAATKAGSFKQGSVAITLVAIWTPNAYTVTFDPGTTLVQHSANQKIESGFTPNWERDFVISTVFSYPTQGLRYLIFGNYPNANHFNVEITANNVLRCWIADGATDVKLTKTVPTNTNITITFSWTASTNKWLLSASGTGFTDSASGTNTTITGTSASSVATGCDYRSGPPFNAISIAPLGIAKSMSFGDAYGTLPTPTKTGYTFKGWYTAASGGTKVESTTKISNAANHTLYAQWQINSYKLTLSYGSYYGLPVHSTNITVTSSSGTVSGPITTSSAAVVTASYSTSPITITLTRANTSYKYTLHNNLTGSWANPTNTYTYSWTPTADKSSTIHVIELVKETATAMTGISSVSVNIQTSYNGSWSTSDYNNADIRQCYGVKFVATVAQGYEFKGWYTNANGTGTPVSTDAEYIAATYAENHQGGIRAYKNLYAFAKVNFTVQPAYNITAYPTSAYHTAGTNGVKVWYNEAEGLYTLNGTMTGDLLLGQIPIPAGITLAEGYTTKVIFTVVSGSITTAGGGCFVVEGKKDASNNGLTTRYNMDYRPQSFTVGDNTISKGALTAQQASEMKYFRAWVWHNGTAYAFNNYTFKIQIVILPNSTVIMNYPLGVTSRPSIGAGNFLMGGRVAPGTSSSCTSMYFKGLFSGIAGTGTMLYNPKGTATTANLEANSTIYSYYGLDRQGPYYLTNIGTISPNAQMTYNSSTKTYTTSGTDPYAYSGTLSSYGAVRGLLFDLGAISISTTFQIFYMSPSHASISEDYSMYVPISSANSNKFLYISMPLDTINSMRIDFGNVSGATYVVNNIYLVTSSPTAGSGSTIMPALPPDLIHYNGVHTKASDYAIVDRSNYIGTDNENDKIFFELVADNSNGFLVTATGATTTWERAVYYDGGTILARKWTVSMDTTVTVTYNANGGTTPSPSTYTYIFANKYTTPTMSRPGYTFNGWYTAASGGTKVTSSTSVTNMTDHTLYAQWSAIKYTLTFNANGGSVSEANRQVSYNTAIGTLPTPTRTGYTFMGWGVSNWFSTSQTARNSGVYQTASGGTSSYSSYNIYEDTMSFVFSRNMYIINSGSSSAPGYGFYQGTSFVSGSAYSSTAKIARTAPSNAGLVRYSVNHGEAYRIDTSYFYIGEAVYETTVYNQTSAKTIVALWKPNTYTVTLNNDSAGSAGTTSISLLYGQFWYNGNSKLTSITKPTKSGYAFGGYYQAPSSSGAQWVNASGNIIASTTAISSNTTWYAKWNSTSATVTITLSGIHPTLSYSYSGGSGNVSAADSPATITVPLGTTLNFSVTLPVATDSQAKAVALGRYAWSVWSITDGTTNKSASNTSFSSTKTATVSFVINSSVTITSNVTRNSSDFIPATG